MDELRPKIGKKSIAINYYNKDNPLQKGEVFFEVPDTGVSTGYGKIKIGDGKTAYEALPYPLESNYNYKGGYNYTDTDNVEFYDNSSLYENTMIEIDLSNKSKLYLSELPTELIKYFKSKETNNLVLLYLKSININCIRTVYRPVYKDLKNNKIIVEYFEPIIIYNNSKFKIVK